MAFMSHKYHLFSAARNANGSGWGCGTGLGGALASQSPANGEGPRTLDYHSASAATAHS
jgi:hypothetical protein